MPDLVSIYRRHRPPRTPRRRRRRRRRRRGGRPYRRRLVDPDKFSAMVLRLSLNRSAGKAGPVPAEALRFFDEKGYAVGFSFEDVWREEHARAFTVAKAMSVDILRDIRGELRKSLAEGKTFDQFRKELEPRLARRGWWGKREVTDPKTGRTKVEQLGSPSRLALIFDVNMRTARGAGQWERIAATAETVPLLQYNLGPSARHREAHVDWDGTILPVTDSFWDTHFTPNGYRCKCWIAQMTETRAARLGGITARPDTSTVPFRNTRTGQTGEVPRGIDPGFDFNPGKERRAP